MTDENGIAIGHPPEKIAAQCKEIEVQTDLQMHTIFRYEHQLNPLG